MVVVNIKAVNSVLARKRWSRLKLHEVSGLNQVTLTKILEGKPVQLLTVAKLAMALEVDPEAIL